MIIRIGSALALILASATPAVSQGPEDATTPASLGVGAEAEVSPAEFLAQRIQAALADPRNARYLDDVERLVPNMVDPPAPAIRQDAPPSPIGEAAAATVRERLAESRRLVATMAIRVRQAISEGDRWLVSPWAPWALGGALTLLLLGTWMLVRRSEHRSVRAARRLARRGTVMGEVARRTGLSQDVIRLIDARRKRKEVA